MRATEDGKERISVTTPRERLTELLDTLADDQVETVLAFATALARGRAVVASCDVGETVATGSDERQMRSDS